LWLQRYGEKSFGDLFVIFGKWLGLYLEIYSESRGSIWNFCGLRPDFVERKGPLCKVAGIFWFGFIFEWKKARNWLTGRGPQAMLVHRRPKVGPWWGSSPEHLLPADFSHGSSPQGGGNEEDNTAQLRGCSPELGRRRGGGALVAVPWLQMATVRVR
jgi:hypothetical protein